MIPERELKIEKTEFRKTVDGKIEMRQTGVKEIKLFELEALIQQKEDLILMLQRQIKELKEAVATIKSL